MGEASHRFASLRQELVANLIGSPSEQSPELVQRLVELPLPLAQKYLEIDAKGILQANIKEQFQVDLRMISTAFNILEKYGRNLLHPRKPHFWRTVKFNNPVFRDTVDTIQGGRDVLRLYGYSEEKADGLYFPDRLLEPNIPHVASVTVDVMMLRTELNLLLSDTHPNPQALQELMQRDYSLQVDIAADAMPLNPLSAISHAGNLPPHTCLLCGLEAPSQHCSACNQSLCPNCDWLFHKHPSRTHHHRVPVKNQTWQNPPPPPPPSLCSIPSETTSLRLPAVSRSLPNPRPPWRCASCQKTNDARSVLCADCDRPRGCKTPQSLSPEEELSSLGQLARGRWSCQTCTFENEAATVLCAVCERPRLAGRPGTGDAKPLIAWGEKNGPQQEDAPSWQCEHCTFRNSVRGRICEMCNCTSLHSDPQQSPQLEKEVVGRLKREVVEAPAEPKGLWRAPPISPEEAEHQRQEKLREDGQKMVTMIREAESVGVAPEMVAAALCYSGAELPLAWLNSELPCVLEGMAELATQRGEKEPGGGLGAITLQEVQTAWVASRGDVDEAVSRCLSARRSKVRELKALGFEEQGPVLQALYQNNGDLWRALVQLQRARLAPFHQRLWESEDPPMDFHTPDRQALLRRLLASLSLPSWGRAELVVSLMLEQPNEGWELADIVEAVKASPSRDFIKRLLSWECAVCSLALPRNKMQSLTSCECTICPECFALHFTIAVKEKHITDLVCPACSEPEISDETELLNYFSTLDIQLRSCLDQETYELFHKKLTEHVLMQDPKFQWCTHCSFGFIYESEQLEAKCPQCRKSFCVQCKRQWEPQHQGLTCDGFLEWKRTNDPEYQAQGLAVYLQENGIACPKCKFSYALARGGCMHFQCSQCRHHFCSGCYGTFYASNKCPIAQCPIRRSLHGHHPRDCLFYLRDWSVPRLQRLLQDNNIAFNTDPPAGTRAAPGGGCRVMEQKETMSGLKDEPCGKETPAEYAGLCEAHYKEYLVSLINSQTLDPAVLYTLQEVEIVCRRHLTAAQLLPQGPAEDEEAYRGRLIQMATSKRGMRSTRKLREWIVEQVESGKFPGVVWDDPPAKTAFRIPWKHAGKQEFRLEEDAGIFKAWAIFKEKYSPGERNPAVWKTRLRCALSKSPEFEEMPARSRLDITEPFKVYRLVPVSEQVVGKQCKAQKTKQVETEHPDNCKGPASPGDWILQPADSLLQLNTATILTPEAMVSPVSNTFYTSAYQSGEVSPQAGEAAPEENEITLRSWGPDSSPAVNAAAGPTEEFSLCLSIFYFGELIEKYLLPEGEYVITSVTASLNAPADCMKRVVLPCPVKIADSPKQEAVQSLLKDLEKGVMVASNRGGIFLQCRGNASISWWGLNATEGQSKLEINTHLHLFKLQEFQAALEQYRLGCGPLPDHRIVLCVGDELEGNGSRDHKPIVIQMEQAFALRLLSPPTYLKTQFPMSTLS
ncbi:E3 ubiquitin-protein ligase RNF31 isoform 2-T3 [Liasis olivaceus]